MPLIDPPLEDLGHRPERTPVVWLLIDDRPGHRTQAVGLARWLGWPAIEKLLVFNAFNRIPNPVLGATLVSVDTARSDPLNPPYPDLVIGMGRRVVPVARWIKRKSGGKTHIVLLGRKAANNPRDVDVSVACAHFQLLPHPGLVELALPPTQVDEATLAEARAAHGDPLADLARPRVLLLAGGPTVHHRFEAAFAGKMAGEAAAAARARGGSLAIVTSRRTPADAVAAMRRAAPEAHMHEWRADRRDNPYLAYLAAADRIVVTGESESMLAEAAATGRPLTIYPLIARPESLKRRFAARVRRGAEGRGLWSAICRALLVGGWITPPRDLDLMHRLMVESGQAGLMADGLNETPPRPMLERRRLAERVAALFGRVPGNRP